ncbi:MAG: hypothetical protein HFG49_07275 [Lachnospiraceae bacterium]|nr:hypothetical protein [Lachnospiraceae bacterium]
MKKVLAAAIVKVLEFDSPEEAREYLNGMKATGKNSVSSGNVMLLATSGRSRFRSSTTKVP